MGDFLKDMACNPTIIHMFFFFFPWIKTDLEHYMFAPHCLLLCKISNTELHFQIVPSATCWLLLSVTKVLILQDYAHNVAQTTLYTFWKGKTPVQSLEKPAVIQKTPQFPGWALQPQFSSRSLLMTPFLSHEITTPSLALCVPFTAIIISQTPLLFLNFSLCPLVSCSHFQIIASLCVSLNIKHSKKKRKHPIVSSQLQSPFLGKPFLSDGLVRPLASLLKH